MRISKLIERIPLGEVNNTCILYGLELDIEKEEIIICDIDGLEMM